jgi:protoporphyrinogen oxidase
VNLGYESKLPLKGSGYLIPLRCQDTISGVLFDTVSFPHLPPQLSVMVKAKPGKETLDKILEELEDQIGIT